MKKKAILFFKTKEPSFLHNYFTSELIELNTLKKL